MNKEPKLRGISLTSILPNIYDTMVNNRFIKWHQPNKEQAGFTPQQGCPIQIFIIYLMMEKAKSINKTIFLGFMDYEKAYDMNS